MMRLPSRLGYWSAGLAILLVMALLGVTGHGLPALGMRLLNGEAWLINEANHSISLIDGYSGKSASQVGLPGMGSGLQVANTPDGAVITDENGHLVKVLNDNFSTSSTIE